MRALLAAFILALPVTPASAAAVLTCSFTEPFFSIGFDPATGTVTRTSPDDDPESGEIKPKIIAEGAKLTIDDVWEGHRSATLRSAAGELLMVIRFKEGSDGMSDFVFPIEGQWGPEANGNNVGGCETAKVQAYDSYELFLELGLQP
ncbi:MAG: hypothetical protein KF849_05190 [Rhizobiaceae bacterium]|nr:hypothetical protein [Rhizobiaceae bacterium]